MNDYTNFTANRTHMILGSIVVVILTGITSRIIETGLPVFDKYLGDALYAVLGYLLLALVWKNGKPFTKIGVTTLVMILIEAFQLTGIALRFSQNGNPVLKLVSIVLGTSFAWLDIVAYIVGIGLIGLIDTLGTIYKD